MTQTLLEEAMAQGLMDGFFDKDGQFRLTHVTASKARLDELAAPGLAFMRAFQKESDAPTIKVEFDHEAQKFFALLGEADGSNVRRYTSARQRDLVRLIKQKGYMPTYKD